jgi:hypothetical protein
MQSESNKCNQETIIDESKSTGEACKNSKPVEIVIHNHSHIKFGSALSAFVCFLCGVLSGF